MSPSCQQRRREAAHGVRLLPLPGHLHESLGAAGGDAGLASGRRVLGNTNPGSQQPPRPAPPTRGPAASACLERRPHLPPSAHSLLLKNR